MEQAEGRTRCDLGTLSTEHLEDEESTVSGVRCPIPLRLMAFSCSCPKNGNDSRLEAAGDTITPIRNLPDG